MGSETIDWSAAQRIGEMIAGSPPRGGVLAGSIEPLAHDFAARVSDYTGLELPAELPPLEVVDRPAWIAANLKTMRPLLDPLTARMGGDGSGLTDLVIGPLRSASGFLLGAQVGALTGVLSQRVLGQYDLALLDATVAPRLLLVAPNLALAARNLGVDRDELVLWVTIHEVTHAVQFSGAPWLRDHLGGMLRELIDGLQVTLAGRSAGEDAAKNENGGGDRQGGWIPNLSERVGGLVSGRSLNPDDLRRLLERARRGELLRLTLGDERWRLVERLQATMSLVEGHAEHTMDAVGAEVLPSLPRLRAAMNRRRESRGLPWRVLERLLGLELKLKQYEVGKRFCDAVVQAEGPRALTRAWSGPEMLPSMAELEAPSLWLARTHVPPVTSQSASDA
ncbi:MAG TPA: zinc-dependent metalloprotease [Solirubrobacteraceae bacterium]|nr:zinc-dependent metalloprotease [Solirubrobacteraceae bacterium]